MSLAIQDETQTVQIDEVCPCSVESQCSCTPDSQCSAECITTNRLRWVSTSKSNQTALYRGEVQLGNYWRDEGIYKTLSTDEFGNDTWTVSVCPTSHPKESVYVHTNHAIPMNGNVRYIQPMNFSYPTRNFAPARRFSSGGFRGNCGPAG